MFGKIGKVLGIATVVGVATFAVGCSDGNAVQTMQLRTPEDTGKTTAQRVPQTHAACTHDEQGDPQEQHNCGHASSAGSGGCCGKNPAEDPNAKDEVEPAR